MESGRVYGSGGGVAWTDRCRLCQVKVSTDTWAQNPETGEQGLRSTTVTRDNYDPSGDAADVRWGWDPAGCDWHRADPRYPVQAVCDPDITLEVTDPEDADTWRAPAERDQCAACEEAAEA